MPKYAVMVQVVKTLKEPLSVYAADEDMAKAKAEKIVSTWEGIDEVQAFSAEEIAA